MAQKTHIQWTDLSSNPVAFRRKLDGKRGWHCEKISPGCAHCYAEMLNMRFGAKLPFTKRSTDEVEAFVVESELRKLARLKGPKRVFVCDMTDLFGGFITDEARDAVFNAMLENVEHNRGATYQILTKRPGLALRYWHQTPEVGFLKERLWLGVSVENQEQADKRIPKLLEIPAAVRFLSVEPLLGPVDLRRGIYADMIHGLPSGTPAPTGGFTGTSLEGIDWVIVGGESGHNARPCNLAWIRSLRDQCRAAGVACFVKQLGSFPIVDYYCEDDSLREWAFSGRYEVLEPAGRGEWYTRNEDTDRYQPPPGTVIRLKLRDKKGGDESEWPMDLRVREFPHDAV